MEKMKNYQFSVKPRYNVERMEQTNQVSGQNCNFVKQKYRLPDHYGMLPPLMNIV